MSKHLLYMYTVACFGTAAVYRATGAKLRADMAIAMTLTFTIRFRTTALSGSRQIHIFGDNQASILSIESPKNQSG